MYIKLAAVTPWLIYRALVLVERPSSLSHSSQLFLLWLKVEGLALFLAR